MGRRGYPAEFRRRVLDSLHAGRSVASIAQDLQISDQAEYAYQRQSCAAAMPVGGHAADVILTELQQQTPEAHSHGFVIQCLSIMCKDGLIQTVSRNDNPRVLSLSGRLGAFIRGSVCRTPVKWLREERMRHHGFSWPKGPKN